MSEPTAEPGARPVTREHEERLHPSRTHHVRHGLCRLREALRDVIARLPEGSGRSVLDLGCGSTPYRPLFEERGYVYEGADLPGNPEAVHELDAEGRLPEELAGRHAVACSFQVLEHVPDPVAHLADARRALVEDGRLVLSAPGTWPYHPDPTDYWRWTRDGLHLQLRRSGFAIEHEAAVLGPLATSVQLTLLAVRDRLRRPLATLASAAAQPVIALADRLDKPALRSRDAALYVLLARPVRKEP